jgi:hypothetical protein
MPEAFKPRILTKIAAQAIKNMNKESAILSSSKNYN